MSELVLAMRIDCSELKSQPLTFLIGEAKRFFPTFTEVLTKGDILSTEEEKYLRDTTEQIDNFNLVDINRVKWNNEFFNSSVCKDCLAMFEMIEDTINNYFCPPKFEPQQKKQTYELLLANKVAIAEVMEISVDNFANKLKKWINTSVQHSYTTKLLHLFHDNTYLLDSLIGLSDDEIAENIKTWKRQTDKCGRPLIENPDNGLKSQFAKELKTNNLIKLTETTFRLKL